MQSKGLGMVTKRGDLFGERKVGGGGGVPYVNIPNLAKIPTMNIDRGITSRPAPSLLKKY